MTDPSSSADFVWDRQDVQAGPATQFDLSSGSLGAQSGFSLASGSCLASSVPGNSYSDSRPAPALGSGYWYLIRATNSCGVGTLGTAQRDNQIAPCP